ncbi:helix-turn-helix domain-containing protein [Granulicella sp. WH15]|uniref:helix-turn-helix domain-containing protein n=1 Tax=Granulicella sp. WH15 TaxID=2602070 RepID=UPI00136767EC|nr:helix-turn-helix domain-containing protein [Granulicella sp. WH15]QHN03813.1 helix-turn-helix domain-containing protein [Granulicella sp. WH15]
MIKTSNKSDQADHFQDWITQAEAARIRDVSPQGISDLIRRGRLQTLLIGGKTFVRRSEVEAFKPTTGGRPRKKPVAKKAAAKKTAAPKTKAD